MKTKVQYTRKFQALFVSAGTLLILSGCGKAGNAPANAEGGMPPMTVQTAEVTVRDVPFKIESFGSMTQTSSVDITAQVTGKIVSVHFTEGQYVKEGELLFTIDKSEYKAELDKAKAQLAEDTASLKIASEIKDINTTLASQTIVAKQQFLQYVKDVELGKAKVEYDKSAVELAQINLGYCEIRSPVTGITGKRLVDPGNIVTGNAGTAMVNIKTIDPIYCDFTAPEKYYSAIREGLAKKNLTVELTPEGMNGKKYEATVDFIDNKVSYETGTVSLRATIANKDQTLWPNQYIKTKMTLRTDKSALTIPTNALQLGKDGNYVFVADNGKAKLVPVVSGTKTTDYTQIIRGDLKAGDRVVTVGVLLLAPGGAIIDLSSMPPQGAAPLAGAPDAGAAAAAQPSKTQDTGKAK